MGGSSREAVVKTGDMVEGRYRIISTLGEGGMGSVFLAEHTLIKRKVAIKILHPELATDADVIERFMNEARAAGTLGHPNIVESTDMGFMHSHIPYIAFEFLEGALLTDEIYRLGGLPVRRAVRIATQIASGLHAAHNAGVVHRDLKSDNVFLTDKDDAFDHVKVLDFGISRFLSVDDKHKGMVLGTPEFMAPEQITDPEHVDCRADVYALGVILYEMLTARRPFAPDEDPRQVLQQIVRDAPPPLLRPEVPPALEEMILTRLLAKQPGDRFQSMSEVEAALETFITRSDGTPVPARRSQPIPLLVEDAASNASNGSRRLKTQPGAVVPAALAAVSLPPFPVRKLYASYAVAGLGLVIGVAGLAFGLRGHGKHDVAKAAAPQPAAAQAQKPVENVLVQLDADVANARITFRHRTITAPASLELHATDVLEIVEVTAPGHKTARYWLTLDRPTHLHAHLVKGTGIAEATEDDTLVALGEAEARPAIVHPDGATTVGERAKPMAAARKIGRATGSDVAHAPAQPVETPVAPPPAAEPKPDEAKPAANVPEAPDPAAAADAPIARTPG
ncbi:MAG TPA: serine/threonine-protein kinase [Kofleriaceae bacterium]